MDIFYGKKNLRMLGNSTLLCTCQDQHKNKMNKSAGELFAIQDASQREKQ